MHLVPRLTKYLYESEVFIRIGEREFCIPRDLFSSSPGNTPNFFTLGFAMLFQPPGNPFPGLNVTEVLRPPAIKPASAPTRCGQIFADILKLLRGYEVHVENAEHRQALLQDCRYYHLKGLEQELIPHDISYNEASGRTEIVLRLEDLRQSGISLVVDPASREARMHYSRPYLEEQRHELVVNVSDSKGTFLRRRADGSVGIDFLEQSQTQTRMASLFRVMANKLQDSTGAPLAVDAAHLAARTTVVMDRNAHVVVDGEVWDTSSSWGESPLALPLKRRRRGSSSGAMEGSMGVGATVGPVERESWRVTRAQWRISVAHLEGDVHPVMQAVKLEAVRGEKGWIKRRAFLD